MVRRRPPSKAPAGSSYLSPARPRVFAHRGLAVEAPENTMLAFAKAIAVGATYIESDVHASSDGIAVIAHDPDLKRLAGREVRIDELTFAELRKIDLGHEQVFCSLAEALDTFPDTRFNIDIKSLAAAEPAAAAIVAARASGRVLVSSFNERRRQAALRLLPGVVSSSSARPFAVALIAGKVGLSPVVRRALRGLVAVQVPEKAIGLRITTERMIRRLHAAGVEVHVWTVNDPVRMHQLLDLGVDGIVTDRADVALSVLRSRS
ncbi:MAG: glycerophosphodiester phosphodiesterase [Actinobacteria bacterium]|nr:glycerophosphodiester phosphodiesterase [Actinomycetota bacterium]